MYPCVRGCLSFQNIRCRGAYLQSLFFILNFYTMASASGTALNICNTLVLQLDEPKKDYLTIGYKQMVFILP